MRRSDVFYDWLPVLLVIALIVAAVLTHGRSSDGAGVGPFSSR